MNNNIMAMVMQMMGQSGGNPQAMAQQILSQNPEFASLSDFWSVGE
mgnify:CR=1 FL=1